MKLAPPHDLTIPEPGSKTAYAVLSRAIGRVVAETMPLVRARTGISDVGLVASALRRPTAGVLARVLRGDRERWADDELVAAIALEASLSGALERDVVVRSPPRRLLSIAHRAAFECTGSVTFPRDVASLRRESPYHAIDGEVVLALADNNPLAMMEAHPDKSGNAIDLGGKPVEEWIARLREALAMVAEHVPDIRREMDLFGVQIVPVGYDDEKHLSASYQEAIGTVYMTLHPNVLTMAEALLHEFSHNKINALFEIDPVLVNAFSPLYTSPLRPDPRPLHGILLAAHALVPMTVLDERARGVEAAKKNARLACEAIDAIVQHGQPTPIGKGVVDELARWGDRFRATILR